jgi:hypothetical protein
MSIRKVGLRASLRIRFISRVVGYLVYVQGVTGRYFVGYSARAGGFSNRIPCILMTFYGVLCTLVLILSYRSYPKHSLVRI